MIILLGLRFNGLAVSPGSAKEFCFDLQAAVAAFILHSIEKGSYGDRFVYLFYLQEEDDEYNG